MEDVKTKLGDVLMGAKIMKADQLKKALADLDDDLDVFIVVAPHSNPYCGAAIKRVECGTGLNIGRILLHTEPAVYRAHEGADELVFELFAQGAGIRNRFASDGPEVKYDHMCLSAYEHAQDYLIEIGMVKAEECSRS